MKIKTALVAAVLAAVSGSAYAAVMYELDPITVTATRTEVALSQVPANTSVVTGEAVEKRHYDDFSQVMRDESSVYIANYAEAGYMNSNSFYINGNNNVVWLLDGVKITNTNGNVPLTYMRDMTQIERVEILKGAASAQYGANAAGGVVNIITKPIRDGVHGELRAQTGSYGGRMYHAHVSGREDGFYWRVGYQKDKVGDFTSANGIRVPQRLSADTYNVSLGTQVSDKSEIRADYERYSSDFMYANHTGQPNDRRYGNDKIETVRVKWDYDIDENTKNNLTVMNRDYYTIANNYTTDITTRTIADLVTAERGNHSLAYGFDWAQDTVTSVGGRKLTNTALFFQDGWEFADGWTVTPGIRMDKHSTFGTHFTTNISLARKLSDRTHAYVSYNEYFIAPTASHLYGAYGNLDMKPETGKSWSVGVQHQFNRSMAGDIHAFRRHSKDKIGFDRGTYKYANFDSEKAYGVNANIRAYLGANLFAKLGYTYTHVDETPQRDTNVDGYIPKHAVVLGLSYEREKFNVNLDVRGSIDRPGPIHRPDIFKPFFPKSTYWVTDISANYYVDENFSVFGRVNNLFDVFYAEHSNSRGNWGKPGEIWPAPGRNYRLGVSYKF